MDPTNEPHNSDQVLENNDNRRNMSCNTDSSKGDTTTDGNCITTVAIQGNANNTSHLHGPTINVSSRKRKQINSPEQSRTEPTEKKREIDTIHQQNEKVINNIYYNINT